MQTYFNPRSPHGERQHGGHKHAGRHHISTHAPRTGSDGLRPRGVRLARNFNPRSPHGERLTYNGCITHCRLFQPTLPARGATSEASIFPSANAISTHAPRTGSDRQGGKVFGALGVFQPTLPARGATQTAQSSTPPAKNFNPRSPHGERRAQGDDFRVRDNFNPRSPHGERRQAVFDRDLRVEISTHAPRTGSDTLSAGLWRRVINFNPRSPHGERQPPAATSRRRDGDFNPRSPHGERRHQQPPAAGAAGISTHAPRTGSDCSAIRRL